MGGGGGGDLHGRLRYTTFWSKRLPIGFWPETEDFDFGKK